MKTTFQFLGLEIHSSWYSVLEEHLERWQRLTAISAAEVILERQRDHRHGFRVHVRLDLPGTTLQAEATARTLKTALLHVSHELETQIQARKARRVERRASQTHPTTDQAKTIPLATVPIDLASIPVLPLTPNHIAQPAA